MMHDNCPGEAEGANCIEDFHVNQEAAVNLVLHFSVILGGGAMHVVAMHYSGYACSGYAL